MPPDPDPVPEVPPDPDPVPEVPPDPVPDVPPVPVLAVSAGLVARRALWTVGPLALASAGT